MDIQNYFIVAAPILRLGIMCNAASHYDHNPQWDTETYVLPDWRTANNGEWVFHQYTAGDVMQSVVTAWIDSEIPDSSSMFDVLRLQRGQNDPLTDAEIGILRAECLVGVQVDDEEWLAANSLVEDKQPEPWE